MSRPASWHAAILGSLALSGCWKLEVADIEGNVLDFAPDAGGPRGWVVETIAMPLECPDGTEAGFQILYPKNGPEDGAPMPAVVLYHSGSFDFVFAPDATQPLDGTHFSEPDRLAGSWALRQVFVTLGMYPNTDKLQENTGVLPSMLTERGVAVLLPANCWGDMWHNIRGFANNDLTQDFFFREGRAAAEWSYRILVDPMFAAALHVELPVEVDPTRVYVIGLGEGGRAVGELLSVDLNADGIGDYRPTGALVDSHTDDLRIFFDDPSLYGNRIGGLARIFPGGAADTVSASLFAVTLPQRFGYLYSSADPEVPSIAHDEALERLVSTNAWIHQDNLQTHVLLNGADPDLTEAALDFLLSDAPAAGAR